MLILIETAAGYALFELKDKGILKSASTICDKFLDASQAQKLYSLFQHF